MAHPFECNCKNCTMTFSEKGACIALALIIYVVVVGAMAS